MQHENGNAINDDERHGHGARMATFVEERRKLGNHPELARRIFIAVASYRAGISYATQEKRMEDGAGDGVHVDPSWGVVAEKLMAAVTESVSERLLSLFG